MEFTVSYICEDCGRLVAVMDAIEGKYKNTKCRHCGRCKKIRVEIRDDEYLTNHEDNTTRREYNGDNN